MVAEIRLRDSQGQRLYLNQAERTAFIDAAKKLEPLEHTFGLTLAMTGCRISEGLLLVKGRFDFDSKTVTLDTLKKRRSGVFRVVPLSDPYLDLMNIAHGLRQAQRQGPRGCVERLWPWSRTAAWRIIKDTMHDARVQGPQATAKGLRHAFAVHALENGVPLPLVQRWLGHSSIETTAIYLQVVGKEERAFASKMW